MHRTLKSLCGLCAASLALCAAVHAAEQPAGAEAKLREALRGTMLQLRDVQTQLATLQATQAELDEKNKSLDADLKALNKKRDAEKLDSEKTATTLKAAITAKDADIAQLRDVVEKAKIAIEQKNKLQAANEEKRKAIEEKAIALDRRVADHQVKNAAMYQLGLEVLARYEKFGLGDAISAREPFIGTTRVKLQNLVQDFQDKLAEQRIKPASAPSHDSAAQQKTKASEAASKADKKKPNGAVRPRD